MSYYGRKTKEKVSEAPHKTPYTMYYPHTRPISERNWNQPYYQVASIDPARLNYALRVERRYNNGWITPIVFDKAKVELIEEKDGIITDKTYDVLTKFLSDYIKIFQECHYIVIERQVPMNYRAVRISQHTISYFSSILFNTDLLPSIVEVDPKLKGKVLGAPSGLTGNQLKTWAVETARNLLTIRGDSFSLGVLDHFKNKQDDLSDTVCQVEALFIHWKLLPTIKPTKQNPKIIFK